MNIRKNDRFKIKGEHILTTCKATSEKAQLLIGYLNEVIERRALIIKNGQATRNFLEKIHEQYVYWRERFERDFKTQEIYCENITTTIGRAIFAQRLGGDNTFTGNVSHTALGTDNTAEVIGDTKLGTETFRKALSSGTDSSNQAFIETFYTAAEVNGTFEEYGHFIDGSGAADSGQLFNRFTQTVVKSTVETLNVQSIITINDA